MTGQPKKVYNLRKMEDEIHKVYLELVDEELEPTDARYLKFIQLIYDLAHAILVINKNYKQQVYQLKLDIHTIAYDTAVLLFMRLYSEQESRLRRLTYKDRMPWQNYIAKTIRSCISQHKKDLISFSELEDDQVKLILNEVANLTDQPSELVSEYVYKDTEETLSLASLTKINAKRMVNILRHFFTFDEIKEYITAFSNGNFNRSFYLTKVDCELVSPKYPLFKVFLLYFARLGYFSLTGSDVKVDYTVLALLPYVMAKELKVDRRLMPILFFKLKDLLLISSIFPGKVVRIPYISELQKYIECASSLLASVQGNTPLEEEWEDEYLFNLILQSAKVLIEQLRLNESLKEKGYQILDQIEELLNSIET